jgi:serine/threonine protein phosphatase PrpC
MAFHNVETDELILAHAGDSRGVLYCGGVAKHSTLDHKPNLPEEKKRIEGAGGRVVFDGYYNYRVFAKSGTYPGLNMSRALGDTRAHDDAGLTAEPDVTRLKLKEFRKNNADLTLLICTDGVWEFIEDQQALVHFKKDNNKLSQGQKAVNDLAQESFEKWMQDSENEISDDITVLVANLSISG